VAPIKRAVDDGTAKELLGEQFKRRLLMDGQYGNVSFICTQTDDCEATEIMRDHQDVALQKPGRWEKMTHLLEKITKLEKDLNDLAQEEEDLKIDLKMADEDVKASKEDLKEASDNGTDEIDGDDEDEVEIDIEHLEALQAQVDANKEAAKTLVYKLDDFKKSNSTNIKRMQRKCPKLQMTLKALCAQVRNEYSKGCLQADFRAGLKDLSRGSEEEEGAAPPETAALPDDFQMDVYCISSNDYLKIQGIKPASDGEANTFSCVRDTQVPQLRTFVHETTARCCETFSKNFVNNTSDMLDRVKLLATDAANVPSGRSSIRCMKSFEAEVNTLVEKIQPIVDHFMKNAEQRVKRTLEPSLKAGAAKGSASAMETVASWGSTNRRRKDFRSPEQNGLWWGTYNATVRRDGAYVSGSAGAVDFNQELCDPMEKEFCTDWQRTMDGAIRQLLAECETKVNGICAAVNEAIVSKLAQEGVDKARLSNMSNAASRSCVNAVKASFDSMRARATETQRNLNRSLLPQVQERMKEGYAAANSVVRGSGVFNRIKTAIEGNARASVNSMFDQLTIGLIKGIDVLINDLVRLILSTGESVNKHLESGYSICCWDDQSDKTILIDPAAMQQKVRECRDRLCLE
jgi:hypothetical protein